MLHSLCVMNRVGSEVTVRRRLVFPACLAGFAYRLRLKRQLHLDVFYEFLDLTVFAVLRALLLVSRLVCHAPSLPQAGRLGYPLEIDPATLPGNCPLAVSIMKNAFRKWIRDRKIAALQKAMACGAVVCVAPLVSQTRHSLRVSHRKLPQSGAARLYQTTPRIRVKFRLAVLFGAESAPK